MGEADREPVECEQQLLRMARSDSTVAHIAVNRVQSFVMEYLQHRQVGKVAGMDDDITGMETLFDLFSEKGVRSDQVRV